MKSLILFLISVNACIVQAGCSYQSGFIRDAWTAQLFKYEIKTKEVRYIRSVQSESKTETLFCIIPLDSTPLYAEAMSGLYKNADLAENQTIGNIREDRRTLIYIFYCQTKLTLSGDVIETSNTDHKIKPTSISTSVSRGEERAPNNGTTQNTSNSAADPLESLSREKIANRRKIKKYKTLLLNSHMARIAGDIDTAINLALQAVELDPSKYEAHKMLGMLYLQKKVNHRAKIHYRAYLKLRPDAPDKYTIMKTLISLDKFVR